MKKILLALFLLPSIALAAPPSYVVNEARTTPLVAPTLGNVNSAAVDRYGNQYVDSEMAAAVALSSDGVSAPTVPQVGAYNYLLNGASTWDRQRSNIAQTIAVSAARTATLNTGDLNNLNGRTAMVVLDVTVASGTGGLQVVFQGKDSLTGNYYNLNATPTAVTATGTKAYVVGAAGGTVAGNVVQATINPIPRTWRVQVIHGDSSSYTYSMSLETLW